MWVLNTVNILTAVTLLNVHIPRSHVIKAWYFLKATYLFYHIEEVTRRCSINKVALKSFAKFLASTCNGGLHLATLPMKRLHYRRFSMSLVKFSEHIFCRTPDDFFLRRSHNPVKHLRWSVLWKYFTVFSC